MTTVNILKMNKPNSELRHDNGNHDCLEPSNELPNVAIRGRFAIRSVCIENGHVATREETKQPDVETPFENVGSTALSVTHFASLRSNSFHNMIAKNCLNFVESLGNLKRVKAISKDLRRLVVEHVHISSAVIGFADLID